jgi:amidase
MTDLAFMDATDQAALVRSGEVTPSQLVDGAIARIEAVNPQIHGVIHDRFEQARDEARGPLPDGPFKGVPCLVKDWDGLLAGSPFHGGNVALRDAGYIPDMTSSLFERLRRAGFVIVGKTNVPEFGLLPTTESVAHGPACNPWGLGHSVGGSSGGSGASVAAGMVPVAHAGDGGGSIRIPASECGLVGLKPTRGRVSVGPEIGEAWGGLVVRGAVTRTVRDTAGVLDVLQGAEPGDPYSAAPPACPYVDEVGAEPGSLRIGVLTTPPDGGIVVHPDCLAAVDVAAALLTSAGHELDDSHPEITPELNAALTGHFFTAYGAWTLHEVQGVEVMLGRPMTGSDVEPATWAAAEGGRIVTAAQYLDAITFFHGFTRQLAAWWAQGHDLLLTPTLAEPPPPLGEFAATADNPLNGMFRAANLVPFVVPFNITGQPAISLPLHHTDSGLPVGVQLVAATGREDLLIRVAAQLEAAAPWADRTPPVHA